MSGEEKREGLPKAIKEKLEHSMLDKRWVFLSEDVNSDSAKELMSKFWYLENLAPGKPILFIIDSPGGSVTSGFAVWDTIKMISSPVVTMVIGLAASFGSLLSLAATKGKRVATKNARIMLHQPLIGGVIRGQATDLEIQAAEILKTRDQIIDIYAEATGKDRSVIADLIARDKWMSSDEALAYGLLDKVVTSMDEVEKLLR